MRRLAVAVLTAALLVTPLTALGKGKPDHAGPHPKVDVIERVHPGPIYLEVECDIDYSYEYPVLTNCVVIGDPGVIPIPGPQPPIEAE